MKGAGMDYSKNKQLDLSDRIVIETGLYNGDSFKTIAKSLNKHPTTISNEIKNNRTLVQGKFILFAQSVMFVEMKSVTANVICVRLEIVISTVTIMFLWNAEELLEHHLCVIGVLIEKSVLKLDIFTVLSMLRQHLTGDVQRVDRA